MNTEKLHKTMDNLSEILGYSTPEQENVNNIDYAWYVGATGFNDENVYTDFSDIYISEGRWENRGDNKYIELVKKIKVGDRIAIKASYTKKNGLPFNNNGKTVGVMSIKAIGTVTENPGDGKTIKVNWHKLDPVKEWYGAGILRTTVHLIKADDGYIKRALLGFTFGNDPQDYSICEEQYRIDEPTDDKIIVANQENEAPTLTDLASILKEMYSDNSSGKTNAQLLFALKYGEIILKNGFSAKQLMDASGIGKDPTTLGDGISLYKAIRDNTCGVRFWEEDSITQHKNHSLPVLHSRVRRKYPLNCILYGAPGTGKTYATAQYALAIIEDVDVKDISEELRSDVMGRYNKLVEAGRIVFTTFHQSYGYEDFIQGIRPDTSAKEMAFKTVDGVFKIIAERAMKDPDNDYVIIIDEINRANISKVFGELITLIEDDKRWGEENAISAILPSNETFAVPNNLYIVGTMNSADKSISLIDTALRRRFVFIEYVPNLQLVSDEKLKKVLGTLNKGIASELNSTDLLVGHSYFMNKSEEDLCDIMNRSIIPLLYEYFFDNHKKVEAQIKKAIEGMDVEIESSSIGRIKLVKKGTE